MTAGWSDRTVIHMELNIQDSGMKYGPGDAVGILPQNTAPLVHGLLQHLGLDGDTVFEVLPASGKFPALCCPEAAPSGQLHCVCVCNMYLRVPGTVPFPANTQTHKNSFLSLDL